MIRSRFRPPFPRINRNSPLANGLVFAGLGGGASTLKMVDASGYGNDGTLTNMDPPTDWVWSPELGRWAMDYDGNIDYVPIGLVRPTSATFMAWAKTDVTVSGSNNAWIACPRSTPGTDGGTFQVGINTSDQFFSYARSTALGSVNAADTTTTTTNGQWYHMAAVYDGATITLYIDGVQTAQAAFAGPLEYVGANATTIGKMDNGASQLAWDGQLADVMILNAAIPQLFIKPLAEPSNVMLSVGGVPLILPPRRVSFPAAVAEPVLTYRNLILGGGVF